MLNVPVDQDFKYQKRVWVVLLNQGPEVRLMLCEMAPLRSQQGPFEFHAWWFKPEPRAGAQMLLGEIKIASAASRSGGQEVNPPVVRLDLETDIQMLARLRELVAVHRLLRRTKMALHPKVAAAHPAHDTEQGDQDQDHQSAERALGQERERRLKAAVHE
jgi:hypothetical protein